MIYSCLYISAIIVVYERYNIKCNTRVRAPRQRGT